MENRLGIGLRMESEKLLEAITACRQGTVVCSRRQSSWGGEKCSETVYFAWSPEMLCWRDKRRHEREKNSQGPSVGKQDLEEEHFCCLKK